jgi:signal transduction histidine kinase
MGRDDTSSTRPVLLGGAFWLGCVTLLGLLACAAAEAIFTQDLVEQDARAVSEVFSDFVIRNLPPSSLESEPPGDRTSYARAMGTVASKGRVLRVSLYDRRGTALWSDDPSRIGVNFAREAPIQDALAGKISSRIVGAEAEMRGSAAPLIDRMHEIHFPIRYAPDAPVAGVLGIYRDAPRLFAAIDRTSRLVWAVSGGGVVLSAVLLGFVSNRGRWRGARRGEGSSESLQTITDVDRGLGRTTLLRMNDVREEEARRIAYALHDEAGQLLASVHIALMEWWQELPPDSTGRLQRITGLLDNMELRLRDLSHELRPTMLDDLGLVPALEFLADQVSKRTGITIVTEGSSGGRLGSAIETRLYRIVQESLTNVVRHARATSVTIDVERDGPVVRCSIHDDGIGFDVAAALSRKGDHGLGLLGIRERLASLHGRLNIESAPGRGTTLVATIPLET